MLKKKKRLHISSLDRSYILVVCLYNIYIYTRMYIIFSYLSFSLFPSILSLFPSILSSKCLCGSFPIMAHSPISPTSAPLCTTWFGFNRARHQMCCPTQYPHRYFHQVVLVQGHPWLCCSEVVFYPFLSLTKLIHTEQKFKIWHRGWHDVHFCCLLWRISFISCLLMHYSNIHIYTVR